MRYCDRCGYVSDKDHLPTVSIRPKVKVEMYPVDPEERQGKKWCVRWQSSKMTSPVYWYYRTRQEAQGAVMDLEK